METALPCTMEVLFEFPSSYGCCPGMAHVSGNESSRYQARILEHSALLESLKFGVLRKNAEDS